MLMGTHGIDEWPQARLLAGQRNILETLCSQSKERGTTTAHDLMFPMLDAIVESTDTLMDLTHSRRMRDCYVIARMVYETSVNTCFLLAAGDAAAKRALRHMKQKSLRDLDRTFHIADEEMRLRATQADEVLSDPENQQLLQEFTSKSGREITTWTPENVSERLRVIHKKFGTLAHGLYWALLLYRHASEIAHGSLFGVLFSWGATEPPGPRTTEDMRRFRESNLRFVMRLTASALNSLIQIVAREIGRDDLARASNAVTEEYQKTPREQRGY